MTSRKNPKKIDPLPSVTQKDKMPFVLKQKDRVKHRHPLPQPPSDVINGRLDSPSDSSLKCERRQIVVDFNLLICKQRLNIII